MLARMEEARLKQIIGMTYDRLYSSIFRLCGDRGLSEDILQETYIKLWNKLDTVTDDLKILNLLKTFARNAMMDEFRKRAKMLTVYPESLPECSVSTSHDQVSNESRRTAVENILRTLPEGQRAVFILRWRHAMPYKEIATTLKIEQGTAETQMNRAIKSIKKQLCSPEYAGLLVVITILFALVGPSLT
jgi:RNA polymerase sigma factor (sigma-70 family)